MVKYVYCVRRRADLSAEQFHEYWRTKHAALICSLADKFGAKRYVQSHTLDTPLNGEFAKSHGFQMQPFDGVTELWWDSMDDFIATNTSPDGLAAAAVYMQDESSFIDFSQSVAFLTEETTVFDFKKN